MPNSTPPLRNTAAVLACLLLLVVNGCGRGTDPDEAADKDTRRPSRRADFLPTIMNMVRPERLGLDTSAEQVASRLNRWRDVQEDAGKPAATAQLSAAARQLVTAQLPAGTLEQIERERYDERDAEHVRTARLMRQIVDRTVRGEPDPVRRAVAVMDYVSRNVELVADGDVPPLTPYEVLLYGRGTAADRAWVFAELLRQLQIDAVALTPADGDTAGSLLVGVLVGEDVLLFDPRLGAAVSPGDADPQAAGETASNMLLPTQPAALADLPADEAGRWRPAVVGTAALWSPRMRLLQGGLRGDEIGAVVYQPLWPEDDGGSVLGRVRSSGGSAWSADDVTLWPYPHEQLKRRAAGDVLLYERLHEPMLMPREIQLVQPPGSPPGSAPQVVLGQPTRALWLGRTDQLLGRFEEAISRYGTVQSAAGRIGNLPNVSLDVVQVHEDAAEDAVFWTGIAQMDGLTEMGAKRFRLAAGRFASYIARHGLRGRHTGQAHMLSARALAEQGDMAAAVAELRKVPESAPLHAAAQFRIRLWSPAETEPKPAVAEKPSR